MPFIEALRQLSFQVGMTIVYFAFKLTVDNIALLSLSVYATQYSYCHDTAMICFVKVIYYY